MNLKKHSALFALFMALIFTAGLSACGDSDSDDSISSNSSLSGKYSFLRFADGQYAPIESLLIDANDSLEATIAYGTVDADGQAELYAGKFIVKANDDAVNGYISIDPLNKDTETCQITVNTDREQNSCYIFYEPDNCPGVRSASLPIVVTYGE